MLKYIKDNFVNNKFIDKAFNRRYLVTMGISISDKLFRIKENIIELIVKNYLV